MNPFLRLLYGTIEITCMGGLFNRFFDIAMDQRIPLSSIQIKGNTATFTAYPQDYKRLHQIARKSQCRMRVQQRKGIRFVAAKIPNKMSLIAGLLIFCLVFAYFGNMIVTIEIGGSSTIPRVELTQSLARNGLRVGMMRSEVQLDDVKLAVMIENDRLAWIAINLSFGRAVVEVRDKTVLPENPESGSAIVAKCDAQIKNFDIVDGYPVVTPGEVVRKGQTLVSKYNPVKGITSDKVQGEVFGYTEYVFEYTLNKYHIFRFETGNVKKQIVLLFGQEELPIPFGEVRYEYFDVLTYEKPVRMFSIRLPIGMRVTEYIEVNQISGFLNSSQAYELFKHYLSNFEKYNLQGCEIMNREILQSENESNFQYTIHYLCYENIGQYV